MVTDSEKFRERGVGRLVEELGEMREVEEGEEREAEEREMEAEEREMEAEERERSTGKEEEEVKKEEGEGTEVDNSPELEPEPEETDKNSEPHPKPIAPPLPPPLQTISHRYSAIGFTIDTPQVTSPSSSLPSKLPFTKLASFTTYDTRLLSGETGLVVPHSTKLLKLRAESGYTIGGGSEEVGVEEGRGTRRNLNGVKSSLTNKKRTRVGRETQLLYKSLNLNLNQTITSLPPVTPEPLLVPIKLNIDLGEYKLKDSFLWNCHETQLTPANFAAILCSDLNLSPTTFQKLIEDSITDQLTRFQEIHSEVQHSDGVFRQNEEGLDIKVAIKLDFLLGRYHLLDNFEWDPNSDLTPEEFATSLVADLGLGGEFVVVIAHSIRSQLLQFTEQKLEILPYLLHRDRTSSSMKEIYRLLRSNATQNAYLDIISPLRTDIEVPFDPFRNPTDLTERGSQEEFVPSLKYLSPQEVEAILIKEEAQHRVSKRRRDAPRRGDRHRTTRFNSGTLANSPRV